MSYDVRLEIDTGGDSPAYVTEVREPTYNLGPMFREALGRRMQNRDGELCLDGMLASEALPMIQAALTDMAKNPAKYRAMEPDNGWGTYDTAVELLRWLSDRCSEHPKATVRV